VSGAHGDGKQTENKDGERRRDAKEFLHLIPGIAVIG
jgi:hypothetical protein